MTTPEGIKDEMRPYMRMTIPPGVERLDPESIELGKRIGRSWVLLFGLTTDRVSWQPRLGLPGAPLRPLIAWFFRHRHKRLRRHFG